MLRGRITTASGAPVSFAQVQADAVDGRESPRDFPGHADVNGDYSVTVPPGRYRLRFDTSELGTIWAHGKEQETDADIFSVGDGQDLVINASYPPMGTVEVTVRDEATGRRLTRGCVSVGSGRGSVESCSPVRGVYRFTDITLGERTVLVTPEGTHRQARATVTSERHKTSRVTVRVPRAAAVVTTIRDAQTNAPLAGVCVQPVGLDASVRGNDRFYCSAADGRLVVGPLDPATIHLFAVTQDDSYGRQWVGRHGGTGDRRRARTITTSTNAPVVLPPIRMDRPGTITGTVRDRHTGAAVPGVCAYPYAIDDDPGTFFNRPFCTDNEGRYTIAGLGPYHWPVEYTTHSPWEDYAWNWSGDRTNRFDATLVRVRTGGTATMDAAMVKGGAQLTGQIINAAGQTASGSVYVRNAVTGDLAAPLGASSFGAPYTVGRLATQHVKIQYIVNPPVHPGTPTTCWYDRKTSFPTATPVAVAAGQSQTLDLTGCG